MAVVPKIILGLWDWKYFLGAECSAGGDHDGAATGMQELFPLWGGSHWEGLEGLQLPL